MEGATDPLSTRVGPDVAASGWRYRPATRVVEDVTYSAPVSHHRIPLILRLIAGTATRQRCLSAQDVTRTYLRSSAEFNKETARIYGRRLGHLLHGWCVAWREKAQRKRPTTDVGFGRVVQNRSRNTQK